MVKPNFIHPTAIIDPTVSMGEGNYIGPFCMFGPNVSLGDNNRFEAYCSVGAPPEHKGFWHGKFEGVEIGSDNIFREFTTINSGTTQDTRVGSGIILLKGAYIGHDSIIEDHVTISCNTVLSGHTTVFCGANLGMGVLVHQYSYIGHYSMLGMGTVVTKKSIIAPCRTYAGVPARYLKPNQQAIDKNSLSRSQIIQFEEIFEKAIKKSINKSAKAG